MADEVTLLDFWPSPFGMRVRLALALKGIEYEYKEENLRDKSPLLLKMNPVHKKIPVLIHNGRAVSESLVIVQYIEETWSDKAPRLLPPDDPYKRAMARFWADYVDKKIYDCGRRTCLGKVEERETAKKELIECLKGLEGELGEKQYFGGESIGLVDVTLLPFYNWFYTFERFGDFSIQLVCPKLVEWGKKCMEESVAKALPDEHKIYEYIVQLRKQLGINE